MEERGGKGWFELRGGELFLGVSRGYSTKRFFNLVWLRIEFEKYTQHPKGL